jgi:hypothetical protein
MKDIAKQYPILTADERFRLFVEAMGRKDEQELDRLEATCPRKHYTAQDDEYTRKKMQFIVYSLASALELLRTDLLANLALVAALSADDDGGDEEKALFLFRQLMQLRQGKRNGWLQFCTRIGVSPDAIAAPFIDGAQWATAVADAVAQTLEQIDGDGSPNAEEIATRQFEALIEAWNRTA